MSFFSPNVTEICAPFPSFCEEKCLGVSHGLENAFDPLGAIFFTTAAVVTVAKVVHIGAACFRLYRVKHQNGEVHEMLLPGGMEDNSPHIIANPPAPANNRVYKAARFTSSCVTASAVVGLSTIFGLASNAMSHLVTPETCHGLSAECDQFCTNWIDTVIKSLFGH